MDEKARLPQLPPADAVIALAADAGRVVLESGGETYRAEETMGDLCRGFGAGDPECYATPTGVMLSARDLRGSEKTAVRRVKTRGINLERVTRTETLRRGTALGRMEFEAVRRELESIESSRPYPLFAQVLSSGASAALFALLFGGRLDDAAVAFCVGALLRFCLAFLARLRVADFFSNVIGGVFVASLSLAAVRFGLASNLDKTIIGALMLLVPGIPIVNAIRDTIAGDLVAGLARGADAGITAAAVSIGTGIAIKTWDVVFGPASPAVSVVEAGFILQVIFALLATAGFAVIFNLKPRDIPLAAIGGAIGWGLYLAARSPGGSEVVAFFAASIGIGFYAETAARLLKKPATVFIVCAIIPLVPGGGMYYTMDAAVRGGLERSLSLGYKTIAVAGAIAVGLAIASSLFRILSTRPRAS
jgi:uncharacterized membrane protein YjjP (DUF1212 family)